MRLLLVKELALSPEAMRMEEQAGGLKEKISSKSDSLTEGSFLEALESVRALFDQLKDLPQVTAQEYANERAESAVLAPVEYLDDPTGTLPPEKWSIQQLNRQNRWGEEGYLLAYSESSGKDDYKRFQMVVKKQGAIFEACQSYNGSHFHPDSYESKLPPAELRPLEDFHARLPESDASGEDVHFIVSFFKDGSWTTRTYRSLPPDNPVMINR